MSLLLAVSAEPLIAAEASEMKIEHSIVINAPPEVPCDPGVVTLGPAL
jgi:hypothetical protein